MLERILGAVGDGGGDLRAGGGERRGETGERERGFVAPHDAAAGDRELGVRLAQGEEVVPVAEYIGPGREVGRVGADFEFVRVAVLRRLGTRLEVERLPGGGRRRAVAVTGDVRDVVARHGGGNSWELRVES